MSTMEINTELWRRRRNRLRGSIAAASIYFVFGYTGIGARAAEPAQITCPARIEIAQAKVRVPPGNWALAKPDRFYTHLAQVDILDGPPEDRATLICKLTKDGNRLSETWDIADIARSAASSMARCGRYFSTQAKPNPFGPWMMMATTALSFLKRNLLIESGSCGSDGSNGPRRPRLMFW